jgi:hypothetical protein
MSKEIKYVMYDDCLPILLSSGMQHARFNRPNVTSAGFCNVEWDKENCKFKVTTYGESVSLGIKSKECDGAIIETLFNHY